MCYSSLPAPDLVALELVSHRMRDLVTADEVAWRACAVKAWGQTQNVDLMAMAAVKAGGWKLLYADKKLVEINNAPWNVPSKHEISAIIERKLTFAFLVCTRLGGSPRIFLRVDVEVARP